MLVMCRTEVQDKPLLTFAIGWIGIPCRIPIPACGGYAWNTEHTDTDAEIQRLSSLSNICQTMFAKYHFHLTLLKSLDSKTNIKIYIFVKIFICEHDLTRKIDVRAANCHG